MAIVRVLTFIHAPKERVFDLARSIDLHVSSTHFTQEKAVSGMTSGLIALGESVTWEARHFFIRQRLTVKISAFDRPSHFQDVMMEGVFRTMVHDHYFLDQDGGTLMSDRFEFHLPFGIFGELASRVFLVPYLERFLKRRNAAIKATAEGATWSKYISIANVPFEQQPAKTRP